MSRQQKIFWYFIINIIFSTMLLIFLSYTIVSTIFFVSHLCTSLFGLILTIKINKKYVENWNFRNLFLKNKKVGSNSDLS
jgi:hypothetical protein